MMDFDYVITKKAFNQLLISSPKIKRLEILVNPSLKNQNNLNKSLKNFAYK